MITGVVTQNQDIFIPLQLLAADQSELFIDAVLDTGFNGFLTLPAEMLFALKASIVGKRRAELGDGKIVELDIFLVHVKWRDEEREILALQAATDPLVGMSMLWGDRVTFDAEAGGIV